MVQNQSRDWKGAGASSFSAGTPRMLFDGPYLPTPGSLPNYDVSPDGQRFLINVDLSEATAAPITVVLNWQAGLRR